MTTSAAPFSAASRHLRIERRDDVRRLRIEVVVRPVEVHRQQVNGVEVVLLPVGLPLHQQHLLRDAVGRIGLLGIAVPQVAFHERHRRQLRIGADGADADELLDAGAARVLQRQRAEHHVLEEEEARGVAVRADAANHRREMNDDVGLEIAVHPRHVRFARQIVLRLARREDGGAARLERRHDVAAEEAMATGHDNAFACKTGQERPSRSGNWVIG